MHELLLYGQVPPSRHTQVLSILAGIAAMQPVPILESHLIFKPHPPTSSSTSPRSSTIAAVQNPSGGGGGAEAGGGTGGGGGGSGGVSSAQLQALQAQLQGETYYLQVVGEAGRGGKKEIHRRDNDAMTTPNGIEDEQKQQQQRQTWTLQFRDLPEVAGRRPVTSRLMTDVQITTDDPLEFMAGMEYTHTSSYILTGHRLTHLSTSLLLSRALVPNPSLSNPSNPPTTLTAPDLDLNPTSTSTLVDPSGTYILQAALRVQDGTKPELMTRGITELLAVKEVLKGVVDLGVGDRLSLDTRVK